MKMLISLTIAICPFLSTYSRSFYETSMDTFFRSNQWQNEKNLSYKDFSIEWQDVIFMLSLPSNYSEHPQNGLIDGCTYYSLFTAGEKNKGEFVASYECDYDSIEISIASCLRDVLDYYYSVSPQSPQGIQFVIEKGYMQKCPYFITLHSEFKNCDMEEKCRYKIDTITTMCRFVILINSCQFSFSYIVDESIYDFSISDKMHVMKSIRFNKKEE